MKSKITISGITIEIHRKKVKNLNVRVYPQDGRVFISCPRLLPASTVRSFAENRIQWINQKLKENGNGKQPVELHYVSGDNIPVWGEMKILKVVEANKPYRVTVVDDTFIELRVRPGSTRDKRKKLIQEWYRAELKREIPKLISKWEPVMGVNVNEFGVKNMKTRWGTCNIRVKRIWLNLQLATKDPDCLEYIVVHEMVHLLERLHSPTFYRLMDKFLTDWKHREKRLLSSENFPTID